MKVARVSISMHWSPLPPGDTSGTPFLLQTENNRAIVQMDYVNEKSQ